MVNSLKALMNSRKFLVMVLDVAVSLVLYFVVKYVAPSLVEDIKFVIAALQPVVVILINSIAKEDAAAKGNPSFHHTPLDYHTPLVVE